MPTEREVFRRLVRMVVRASTVPCSCVGQDHEGRCWDCSYPPPPLPPGVPEPQGDPEPCRRCDGSGICPWCQGALQDVPAEFSSAVVGGVLMAYFNAMSMTRAAEQWGRFNEQWDTLRAWLDRAVAENPLDDEGLKRAAQIVAEELQEAPPPAVRIKGALSDEDLRELGVLPEEKKKP